MVSLELKIFTPPLKLSHTYISQHWPPFLAQVSLALPPSTPEFYLFPLTLFAQKKDWIVYKSFSCSYWDGEGRLLICTSKSSQSLNLEANEHAKFVKAFNLHSIVV